MQRFRILIVDDHGIVRAGIRSLLESEPDMEVVAEASLGEKALEKAVLMHPDVVLMDIALPDMSGIEAGRRIKERIPDAQILMLTMHDDQEFFYSALRAGASGYMLKGGEPQELLYAIRAVSHGQVFLAPAMAKALLGDFLATGGQPQDEGYGSLTPREKEVLRLAAAGKTNREMAESLALSVRTVEKYRQAVMQKLGLSRREELTKYAIRKGLIGLDD